MDDALEQIGALGHPARMSPPDSCLRRSAWHAPADGRKITQDCNNCHRMLAMDEAAPKVLTDLGLAGSDNGAAATR